FVNDPGFGHSVAGVGNNSEVGARPSPLQIPRVAQGSNHVIAAVYDHARNVGDFVGFLKELAVALQKASVHEVVALDAGESDRIAVVAELANPIIVGKKRQGCALPDTPGLRRFELDLDVRVGEALVIGADHV